MSIDTVLASIQALALTVTGISTAPTNYPSHIEDTELPMAMTWPDAGQWPQQGAQLWAQVRTYRVVVYVKPFGKGLGIYEAMQAVTPILEAAGKAFRADPTLGSTVHKVINIRDEGIEGALEYSEGLYWGFQLSMDVTERWS